MTTVSVFFLGATGYLGGKAVFANLIENFSNFKITALVRRNAHLDVVRRQRVEVVQGTFSDTDLITSHARAADITVNIADSDDVGLTTAILAGQKARVVKDKKNPAVLLHTSGVAVWNDGNEEDIRAINSDRLHGPVDVSILHASTDGYTESYIICPGAIVGPVVTSSLFFRFITALALKQKKSVYIGEGSNVFYGADLEDLVDLYKLVFERILSRGDAKASPYARYYIAANTPLVWKNIATLLGKTLKQLGKIEDAVPQSISVADLSSSPEVPVFIGASQNVQGERAQALGWNPRAVELEESMDEGVKVALEADRKTDEP
ncbi:NAD-binding protein [Lactarius akahatsu]|uniref:NAD-binding protein n=1 Tax=Lactarius akahatsu TaxID=416441 RepID=A0AAD4L7S3_9AGAM|nr:NAD-binding protein [Lactarius akahatsu]